MSSKKQPPSPGAALVAVRWAKSEPGDPERKAVGERLAAARKKLSKKKRREIAKKAAATRWAKEAKPAD